MICLKCDKDLAECTCLDRVERLTEILGSKHLYIGAEYRQRIKANIERCKKEREQQEQE